MENTNVQRSLALLEVPAAVRPDGYVQPVEEAMPFELIINALRVIHHADPNSHHEIMFLFHCATGCRISELDNFSIDCLVPISPTEYSFSWHRGKRQSGYRKISVPLWAAEKLIAYRHRQDYRFNRAKMFGVRAHWYRRGFDRQWRPMLGGAFLENGLGRHNNKIVDGFYRYQMSGIRTIWATHFFQRAFEQYRSAEVSVSKLQQAYGHESSRTSFVHYCHPKKELHMEYWSKFDVWDILRRAYNSSLDEWCK